MYFADLKQYFKLAILEVLVRDWLGEAPEDRELQRLQEILEANHRKVPKSNHSVALSGSEVLVKFLIFDFVHWRCLIGMKK